MTAAAENNGTAKSGNSAAKKFAIEIENVTVAYRAYKERPTSLKETIVNIIRRGQLKYSTTFDALAQLSLTVEKGTVLGVIGSNGSGKSTLLKVLAGVLKPTSGMVRVNGSVASLIELGVGFDPEQNAIENIYLNGALHKKSKSQISKRVNKILDFAELHEFAFTPIKYYSSGMGARLGFGVAIDINPDVLLVDEILAVGDERFQSKCLVEFQRFLDSGKTIVMVSHNMEMLAEKADKIALLSKGKLVFLGDPTTALNMYRDRSYETALR